MEKKHKVSTSPERDPLVDSPFAMLQGGSGLKPAPETGPIHEGTNSRPYQVGRTRKGGYALSVEKRSGGKVVTVLGNVGGDADALLGVLKKHCGAGGAVREEGIELQGDHRVRIEEFLKNRDA
jgi:translation initiation factor 1 (eIF-1/SUI1)